MNDLKMYCTQNIEAAQCEIDNVAIVALSQAVIQTAGLSLEIMYLVRSQGDEVNVSHFAQPTDVSGQPLINPPTIRLLYRP
jgi:ubiquitin thioesterase protein OTUB1